jgi:hypothetical protein
MKRAGKYLGGLMAIAIAAGAAAPASASTFIREDLDALVAGNETIVVGEVVGTRSYWNSDASFILTDVRIAPRDILKGNLDKRELTITVLGGTVADLTTVIVGGANLERGSSYLLFLQKDNLPGVKAVRTVRDHSQGVFDIVLAKDGLRAISQANRHPLQPDAKGLTQPPGGAEGLPLGTLMNQIRERAARPQSTRREVK